MEIQTLRERVRIGLPASPADTTVAARSAAPGLEATLVMPPEPAGLVVVAYEHSRQRSGAPGDHLSTVLREARLATLTLDLSDVRLLPPAGDNGPAADATQWLRAACDWVQQQPETGSLPLGLAGAGSAAAAMLQAAADLRGRLCALVARGMHWGGHGERASCLSGLAHVTAPTLLVAGSLDPGAVTASRETYAALRCPKRFEIVAGATRSLAEPGSMEMAARLVRGWFVQQVFRS